MNIHWWVDIDQSTPMGWYSLIYNDEQISVTQHQWVDINKSTPFESILTNTHWHDNVSVNLPLLLISTNLPWQVDIDKYTQLRWYLWIYPIESISIGLHWRVDIDESITSSQYQLIYTDGLISRNLPLMWYL